MYNSSTWEAEARESYFEAALAEARHDFMCLRQPQKTCAAKDDLELPIPPCLHFLDPGLLLCASVPVSVVPGVEPRAWCKLGKHCID